MINYEELANQAAELEDQTETKSGPEYAPPAAGKTYARFIEYIELGMQPQKPYQGKPKDPAPEVVLTFELLGPKHVKQITVDGVEKTIAERITVRLNKSLNEKAKFKKLFVKMTYGRDAIKHMAQMLGEGFVITVVHNEVGEGDKKRTYANITDKDGSYLIAPPVIEDIETGAVKKIKIPEAISSKRLFLFDLPTKEQWDSIFIDGTYETKDTAGKTTTVSKNKYQALIKSAVNFQGSKVEDLVTGGDELPVSPEDLIEDDSEVEIELEEEVVEKKPIKKKAPKKEVDPEEDALSAMGLNG